MKQLRRSHEPVAWSLFGAGGMVLALFTPALILVTGIFMPFFYDSAEIYQGALTVGQSLLGKLFLLVVIATQLYHTAHRVHHGLHDVHIHGPEKLMLAIFYGGSTILSLMVMGWLFSL